MQGKGNVTLETTCGEGINANVIEVISLIVDALSPYNIILGRPTINVLEVVNSTRYMVMKYPLPDGRVGIIRGDLQSAQECLPKQPSNKKRRARTCRHPSPKPWRVAIDEEIGNFSSVEFIMKMKYPTWLANMVPVKKATNNWCLYVDFTDLNIACSKDSCLLRDIHHLIDRSLDYQTLIFMDAYSRYNQIQMDPLNP